MVEDDVISKRNYFAEIKNFLKFSNERTVKNPWKILKISPIGTLATLYKSSDLSDIIAYLEIFYNDKPIDWLLEEFLRTKFCVPETKPADCEKLKSKVRLQKTNPVFKHVGRVSSLAEKRGQELQTNKF